MSSRHSLVNDEKFQTFLFQVEPFLTANNYERQEGPTWWNKAILAVINVFIFQAKE